MRVTSPAGFADTEDMQQEIDDPEKIVLPIDTNPYRDHHLVNPRRVGFGGLADREQTQVPRARRWRALRPAPGVARGPQCPRRPRRASHLSQRVGRARASSGASARRAVRAPRALHSRADWPRAGAGEIGGYMDY